MARPYRLFRLIVFLGERGKVSRFVLGGVTLRGKLKFVEYPLFRVRAIIQITVVVGVSRRRRDHIVVELILGRGIIFRGFLFVNRCVFGRRHRLGLDGRRGNYLRQFNAFCTRRQFHPDFAFSGNVGSNTVKREHPHNLYGYVIGTATFEC